MSITEKAPPTATTSPASKIVRLNHASREMLEFISVMTGERTSHLLYRLLRDEVRRHSDEVSWTPAPAPFVVRPTSMTAGTGTLLWNPHIGAAVLTGSEAVALADAITDTLDGKSANFTLTPSSTASPSSPAQPEIRVIRGGRYVTMHIGDRSYSMPLEVARDLAASLDDCSVHCSLPQGGATVH